MDALYQSAKAAGKLLGVYHFARESGCTGTAVAEADWFIVTPTPSVTRTGHPAGPGLGGRQHPDVGWALQWLMEVEAKTGIKPLLYMNQSVENCFDWSAAVAQDFACRWPSTTPRTAAPGSRSRPTPASVETAEG